MKKENITKKAQRGKGYYVRTKKDLENGGCLRWANHFWANEEDVHELLNYIASRAVKLGKLEEYVFEEKKPETTEPTTTEPETVPENIETKSIKVEKKKTKKTKKK